MKPRGYILLYGLALLVVMTGAVALLARRSFAQASAEARVFQRETLVRRGEELLELARQRLNRKELAAGQSFETSGAKVLCSSRGSDVQLEILMQAPAKPRSKLGVRPREGVRVAWILTESKPGEWLRKSWFAEDEVRLP